MKIGNYMRFVESMNRLEAHEMLIALKVADYPNMKTDARNRLHRKLYMAANPIDQQRMMTTEEAFAVLKGE